MKITLIGAGNIGGATAIGLSSTPGTQITVTAAHPKTLSRFVGSSIATSLDNVAAVRDADIVIVALKPMTVRGVMDEIRQTLNPLRQIVVSMVPGIRSEELSSMLPKNMPLAYVIPNTAIEVSESMTFISPITTTPSQTAILEQLFSGSGKVMTVSENLLAAGTALASCGIAYALRYIRAASEGGIELGFLASDAQKIVGQTVLGAATLLSAHGTHPETEIDRVTTPAGMTIRGLNAMEQCGFTNAVISGLTAIVKHLDN